MSEEKFENNNKKNVRSKRRTNSQVKKTRVKKINKKEGEEKKEVLQKNTKRNTKVRTEGKTKNRNIQKEIFKASKLKIIPLRWFARDRKKYNSF